jgi:hypothetical protein
MLNMHLLKTHTVITNSRVGIGLLEALKGLPFLIVAGLKSLD